MEEVCTNFQYAYMFEHSFWKNGSICMLYVINTAHRIASELISLAVCSGATNDTHNALHVVMALLKQYGTALPVCGLLWA